MGYRNACEVLPPELVSQIQKYVDGEIIYIPRQENRRKKWGDNTLTRSDLHTRNDEIHRLYLEGTRVKELAERFYLSTQCIYKILSEYK